MTTLEPLVDRTVADRVAERIRDAIHDGSYAPGTRLVQIVTIIQNARRAV